MTIKKRLFVSNILMIVIPAFLAVLTLAAGLFIFFSAALPDSGYRLLSRHELEETRSDMAAEAVSWLSEQDADKKEGIAARLNRAAEQNQIFLIIEQNGSEVGRFGRETAANQEQLIRALEEMNNAGTISDGNTDLYGEQITVNGGVYQLKLFNPVVSVEGQKFKAMAAVFALFLVVVVLFIVFLTNRFLTRFMFRNISNPIKILTEGVRQIHDGNLSYRISYSSRDEFLPVCEAFNDMAERLGRYAEQSQKGEESRKELLAGISHDIRSPLTSIRAYVEGLLDGVADTPEKQKAYLATIHKKTIEIDQMVKKLFLFSKMDMGEYPYLPERLNASREITDFIIASEDEYRRQGLKIVINSLPQNAFIDADQAYFRSILMNLLDNSAKYRQNETGTVTITGMSTGHDLILYIDDDGPGVPEEALPKLFDVFYRSDPSRKSPNQGSGLGLAIVSKSIERMNGSVRAENLPNGGLRITLRIPLSERTQEK